jgi:hypothetical protein
MRALILALVLSACGPSAPPTTTSATAAAAGYVEPTRSADTLDLSGEWRLTEMNGRAAPQLRDADDAHHPITASVGAFAFRAQSQCIAFWRRYAVEGERVRMSELNPGAMCARGLSDWEREFDRSLSAVTGASRTEGSLTLTGPDVRLVFASAPPEPSQRFLGLWRLRVLHGQPPAGPPIDIEVTETEIRANACVFAGWRYRQDGPLLETTRIPGTVCERTLTAEEQRFGALMDRLHRATLLPDGALILDSPSEQFEFRQID